MGGTYSSIIHLQIRSECNKLFHTNEGSYEILLAFCDTEEFGLICIFHLDVWAHSVYLKVVKRAK
jgi:hypothetical protein